MAKQLTKKEIEVILKNKPQGVDTVEILDGLVKRGYELEGVDMQAARAKVFPQDQGLGFKDALGDVKGVFKDIKSSAVRRSEKFGEAEKRFEAGEQGRGAMAFQKFGQGAGFAADVAGSLFEGAIKLGLSPEEEAKLKAGVESLGEEVASLPITQKAVEYYASLPETTKANIDAFGGIAALVTEVIGLKGSSVAGKATKRVAGETVDQATKLFDDVVASIPNVSLPDSSIVQGTKQTISDFGERIPRAVQRGREGIEEAAIKSQRIAQSSPEFGEAIRVGVDDRILNTIEVADAPTISDMKRMVDIAENPSKKLGRGEVPSIVAGEAATKQADLIFKRKQEIGRSIGKKAEELSKDVKVDMRNSVLKLENELMKQGVRFDEKGALDFTATGYSPKERAIISDLYKLAKEGGDNLTPSQIYKKDQLFSKLNREARFEGVGDIIVQTEDGNKNLFNLFREVYSNKLSEIDPDIRLLNKQYADIIKVTSDIEKSIFKAPNLNVAKIADEADFAKTNLRRILGDAQSSGAYAEIANQMDELSRALGYDGANPVELIDFAEELRRLYPETVPKTGFAGGIRLGIGDIVEKVTSVGKVTAKDQQKALRNLLDALTRAK